MDQKQRIMCIIVGGVITSIVLGSLRRKQAMDWQKVVEDNKAQVREIMKDCFEQPNFET